MRRIACIAVAVVISVATPVSAGPYDAGFFAAQKGAFGTALRLSLPLAHQGDADAQFDIGKLYHHGRGVPQDYVEAIRWYRMAADQGHADAQYVLASMYDTADGVPQDYAEAIGWYRKAAENGVADVYSRLGFMYDKGQGTLPNPTEAVRWYRKAADQGDPGAQNNLGSMYYNGAGVPQDYVQAHKWYSLAASRFPASDRELRDLALRNVERAVAEMTPAQIADAEKLVQEWKRLTSADAAFWTVAPAGKTIVNLSRDLPACRLWARNSKRGDPGAGTTVSRMIGRDLGTAGPAQLTTGQDYLEGIRRCMLDKGYR